MTMTFKVEREDARGRVQTVFEGNEADARRFLADNYPRVHVEPGSATGTAPDAWLLNDQGKREVHYGPEHDNADYEPGFGPHPDDESDTQPDDEPDDDDDKEPVL